MKREPVSAARRRLSWLPAEVWDDIGDLVPQDDPAVVRAERALARTFPDCSDKVFFALWAQVAVTAARAENSHGGPDA